MTKDEAIKYGKEQLEVFGGKHAEFIKLAIEILENDNNKKLSIEQILKDASWYIDKNGKRIYRNNG